MKFEDKLERLLDSLIERHPDHADRPCPPRGKIGRTIANACGEHWMQDGICEWAQRCEAMGNQSGAFKKADWTDNPPLETQSQLEETQEQLGKHQQNLLDAHFDALQTPPTTQSQLEEHKQYLAEVEQRLAKVEEQEEQADTPIPPWIILLSMHSVHLIWQTLPEERRKDLKHPNAALLEAWLLRPEPIQPDGRLTGIIPANLIHTPARYSNDTDTGALFDLSEFERAPNGKDLIIPDAQAHLPGLDPQPSALVPILPFLLWDHNIPASRGRGAPYGLRLWIEAVLSLPPKQPYRRQEFQIRWGEIVNRTLAGRDNRKNTERLWQALHTVHNLRLAWGEPGARTGRAAVQVPDIPQTPTEYGAVVRFVIELPPGAGNGPLVYKPFLRKIARWSAPAYRAALTLAYLWDRYGSRKGRYIQPTIPRLARDHAGRLIDRDGQIITAKDGKPIAKYMIGSGRNRRLHPDVLPLDTNREIVSSIRAAARERNPAADRYPILTPSDLVRLCYPDAQITRDPIKATARRKRQQRASQVLQEMAERTYLNIEETPDGWRVLPPDGWGASFRSDDQ